MNAQALMATETGSDLTDYSNPEFDNAKAANAADKEALGLIAAAAAGVAPAEVPSEVLSVLAFVLQPTKARFASVATLGAFRYFKALAGENKHAYESVERAGRAAQAGELIHGSQEQSDGNERRRKGEERERQRKKNERDIYEH